MFTHLVEYNPFEEYLKNYIVNLHGPYFGIDPKIHGTEMGKPHNQNTAT